MNRKDSHSINVQIWGNGDLQIIDVVAKWPGSVHDSRILKNSKLYEKFREGELPSLPNGVILGDSGYPLLEWLLVPFVEHPGMTAAQKLYDKAQKIGPCCYRENNRHSKKKMGVPKWTPIQAREMLRSNCCVLYAPHFL